MMFCFLLLISTLHLLSVGTQAAVVHGNNEEESGKT